MKHLGFIYIDSLQSVSIASIKQDDKRGEFKLQDEFSAKSYWFKALDDLINNVICIDFIRSHTERLNGKVIIVYLHDDNQKLYSLPPEIHYIDYKPF